MALPLPPKKEVALALLEQTTAFVHLDPRLQGVVVPMTFKSRGQLELQVGLNMAVPIPDLRVEDDGLSCTLSFSGRPFWCSIPWSAVYAVVGEDGRGMVWPEDLPPELAQQQQQQAAAPAPAEDGAPAKKRRTRTAKKTAADLDGAPPRAPRARKKPQAPEAEPAPAPALAPMRERLVAVRAPSQVALPPAPAPDHAPAAAPTPAAPLGQRKPKRELPPYLRVVK